jgi:hypothetical protein
MNFNAALVGTHVGSAYNLRYWFHQPVRRLVEYFYKLKSLTMRILTMRSKPDGEFSPPWQGSCSFSTTKAENLNKTKKII